MLGLEFAELQVDGYQAAQPAVKEQEVDVAMAIADGDSELPIDEAEVTAELEQELLQVLDECLLEVPLFEGRRRAESEELENVRVTELGLGAIVDDAFLCHSQDLLAILAQADTLVEHAVALPLELPHGPAFLEAVELVEGAAGRIVDAGQLQEVRE